LTVCWREEVEERVRERGAEEEEEELTMEGAGEGPTTRASRS